MSGRTVVVLRASSAINTENKVAVRDSGRKTMMTDLCGMLKTVLVLLRVDLSSLPSIDRYIDYLIAY